MTQEALQSTHSAAAGMTPASGVSRQLCHAYRRELDGRRIICVKVAGASLAAGGASRCKHRASQVTEQRLKKIEQQQRCSVPARRWHRRQCYGSLGPGCVSLSHKGASTSSPYRPSTVSNHERVHLSSQGTALPELRRRVTAPSPLPVLRFTRVPAMMCCCLVLKGNGARCAVCLMDDLGLRRQSEQA